MITMEDWVTIKNLKVKNPELGTRRIAELLHISRNTVKKALQSQSGPNYQRGERINADVEPFKDYIYERLVVKKLRGSRVLSEIKSKGYQGSKSAFYRYISKIKASHKRTYQPYETAPAVQAQFDWSPYTVTIAGKLTRVYVFCYILSWSRYRIYQSSLSDTQGSILEAIENSLQQTGGTPQRLQTDNAKSFVTNASRQNFQWNKRYLQFCGHYGFEPSRSLPAHPWSKGKVENPFDYLGDHFIAANQFTSFQDFICQLEAFQQTVNERIHSTTQKPPCELFETETNHLAPLPQSRYVSIKEETRKATADCLISFMGNKYSVPHLFACTEVWVTVSQGYLLKIFSAKNKLIATHHLSFEKGKVIMEKSHYRNHSIERGNWERMAAMFKNQFPRHEWFTEKLKAQKRINPLYHLSSILETATYYSSTDMEKAFQTARQYNAYSAQLIKGFLQTQAKPLPPPITHLHRIEPPQAIDIKRPLSHYQSKTNNYANH